MANERITPFTNQPRKDRGTDSSDYEKRKSSGGNYTKQTGSAPERIVGQNLPRVSTLIRRGQ